MDRAADRRRWSHRFCRIERLGLIAILGWLLFALPAGAVDWSRTASVTASRLDQLRYDLLQARLRGDTAAFRSVASDLLTRSPGDGFALRQIAWLEIESRGHESARTEVNNWGDALQLGEAEREYMAATVDLHRSHYYSARKHLDRAIELRPGWSWARIDRARAARDLLQPRAAYEPDLQAGLEDPESVVRALIVLGRLEDSALHAEDAARARAILLASPTVGWAEADVESWRRLDRIRDTQFDQEQWIREWHELEARVGRVEPWTPWQWRGAMEVAGGTRQALQVLDRLAKESDGWMAVYASTLLRLGEPTAARRALRGVHLSYPESLKTRFELERHRLPPDSLVHLMRMLEVSDLSGSTVSDLEEGWVELGHLDERDRLRARCRLENPGALTDRRLSTLVETEPALVRGTVDSMRAVGIDFRNLSYLEATSSAALGDTVRASAAAEADLERGSSWSAISLAEFDLGIGEKARSRRWIDRALAGQPRDAQVIGAALQLAVRANDEEWARTLEEQAEKHCELWGQQVLVRLLTRLIAAGGDRASALLAELLASGNLGVPAFVGVAEFATALGDGALMDAALARAPDPDDRRVKLARAKILMAKRDFAGASQILQELRTVVPGLEGLTEAFATIGASQADVHPGQDSSPVNQPSGFSFDFEAVDWIQALRDSAGPAQDADVRILHARKTIELKGKTERRSWRRLVLEMVTEAGVNTTQPYRIGFNPNYGLPRMHVARVIRRDGTVVVIPPSEILVAGADTEADVSDRRELVIAARGLEPGALLDLAWEEDLREFFYASWAEHHFFGSRLPVVEDIFEVSYPTTAPPTFLERGVDAGEAWFRGETGYRRWRVSKPERWQLESNHPDPYGALACVGVSTHESWAALAKVFQRSFHRAATPDEEIARRAREWVVGARTNEAKVDSIFAQIVRRTRYLALALGPGALAPRAAREVLDSAYGDCKDMTALFIAALDAVGIEAVPVLVSPRPGLQPDPQFPAPECFSHAVACVPDVRGYRPYDLTVGVPASCNVPASLGSVTGLLVPSSGEARLIELDAARAEDHRYACELDVRPTTDRTASYQVTVALRGDLSRLSRLGESIGDSATRDALVRRVLGFPLPATAQLRSWRVTRNDGVELRLESSWSDSAWAELGANSRTLALPTEIGEPFADYYPTATDHPGDFLFDQPFQASAVIRLHSGGGWTPDAQIAELAFNRPGWLGEVKVLARGDREKAPWTVKQRFEVSDQRLSGAEYAEFRANWLRMLYAVHQLYRYRRDIDREESAELVRMVREHPDDVGYASQAANRLLGSDLGGDGEPGRERRRIGRELLRAAAQDRTAGSAPLLLLAGMAMVDGRWYGADSLLDRAAQRDSNDVIVQSFRSSVKTALLQHDEAIHIVRRLARRQGGRELEQQLIRLLYITGRDEEAQEAERRYRSLYGAEDSTLLVVNRLVALQLAGRGEQALSELDALDASDSQLTIEMLRGSILSDLGRVAEAAAIAEKHWEQQPLNAIFCNNLAWYDALLGRELERAEELATAAVALSGESAGGRNTLGAVYARRGEWTRARAAFQRAWEDDDRPESRAPNEYFLGLCDYLEKDRRRGVQRWEDLLKQPLPAWLRPLVEGTLAAHRESRSVTGVVFPDPPASQE